MVRQPYVTTALTGFGAAQRGGRWNSRGVAVVYASESRALAMLETLAHADFDDLPSDLEYVAIDIPDDQIASVDVAKLPRDWNASPPLMTTRRIGDDWVAGAISIALRIPSAVVDGEFNVIVNPAHPRFADVTSEAIGPARIDSRVTRRGGRRGRGR